MRVDDVARNCAELRVHCVAPVLNRGVLTARPPLFNLVCAIAVGIDGGRLAAMHQRMLSNDLGQSGVVILAVFLTALCLAAMLRHRPFRMQKEVDVRKLAYPDRVVPGLPGKVRP